jgi:hypothetical protein
LLQAALDDCARDRLGHFARPRGWQRGQAT